MRAVRCVRHGAPEDLVIEDLDEPVAGEGQVVVEVAAAALNFPDVLLVADRYQLHVPVPFTPGSEFPAPWPPSGPASTRWPSATR